MGLRSWLTKAEDVTEYVALQAQIRHNPIGYGAVYVIAITEECPLDRGVWVAWSGDGGSSVTEFMSPYFAERTRLLDNLTEECPDFNDNPAKYGRLLEEADILGYFTEREGIGDGEVRMKLLEEARFARQWAVGLRKNETCRRFEKKWRKFEKELEKEF